MISITGQSLAGAWVQLHNNSDDTCPLIQHLTVIWQQIVYKNRDTMSHLIQSPYIPISRYLGICPYTSLQISHMTYEVIIREVLHSSHRMVQVWAAGYYDKSVDPAVMGTFYTCSVVFNKGPISVAKFVIDTWQELHASIMLACEQL